ncbi:MAG: choice-of-anchor E domain-containing protein [Phycisphaerales bacterium]|nr:choice-of-anchor E domain-containing protein [Phycisphaerales bacterium]
MSFASVEADTVSYQRIAGFTSDLESDVILTFPTFDNQGGSLVLTDVRVDVRHRAGVIMRADNDDRFKEATVNGRMIRTWSLSGPDMFTAQSRTKNTPVIQLEKDDGDAGIFDSSAPDGTDFGLINYGNISVGPFSPDLTLYDTNGPDSVDFIADVLLMVNDLQFVVPPDVWQLEVQRPYLQITVDVTYTFRPIPLPAAAWLGALGLGLAGWVRRYVA